MSDENRPPKHLPVVGVFIGHAKYLIGMKRDIQRTDIRAWNSARTPTAVVVRSQLSQTHGLPSMPNACNGASACVTMLTLRIGFILDNRQ